MSHRPVRNRQIRNCGDLALWTAKTELCNRYPGAPTGVTGRVRIRDQPAQDRSNDHAKQ